MSAWERARKARIVGQVLQYKKGFLDRDAIAPVIPVLYDLEAGLWAELGISPVSPSFADVMEPIRAEIELRDQ